MKKACFWLSFVVWFFAALFLLVGFSYLFESKIVDMFISLVLCVLLGGVGFAFFMFSKSSVGAASAPVPPKDTPRNVKAPAYYRQQQSVFEAVQGQKFLAWIAPAKPVDIVLSAAPAPRLLISDMPAYSTRGISKTTSPDKIPHFVVVDVETTGLQARQNEIVEVAAVHFEEYAPVEYFTTLVKPKRPIPADATKINGITDSDVAAAPPISAVIPALKSFIGSAPIVAHNLPFDVKFLYSNGLNFFDTKRSYYDTLELSKKAYKGVGSYRLKDICRECRIFPPAFHRALHDCYAAGALFSRIVSDVSETDFFEIEGPSV